MNYIGSKLKLTPFIFATVKQHLHMPLAQAVFCDIFAGTGIVGRYFKAHVQQVISNDIEYYSYVLNRHYIGNTKVIKAQHYIDELNELAGIEGFIYKNYCVGEDGHRQYFSDANGKKIDAIRQQIEKWYSDKYITDNVYFLLLTALLENADKVANTASVYGAYLKKIKASAAKPLVLSYPEYVFTGQQNKIYQQDSNQIIDKIKGDVLYLDPPYNSRQYGANYHMLNTIAQYDTFIPQGKTGLRPNYKKSNYCKKGQAADNLHYLIKNARFKYIFLSYNNEGIIPEHQIRQIMEMYGQYSLATQKYQRFKADTDANRKHKASSTIEYIHILTK